MKGVNLFLKDQILTLEIESWRGFADSLPKDDKDLFLKMLERLHHYSTAINSKANTFPTEPVIMALVLE